MSMVASSTSRGYLLVRQDWYELPGESDPLKRNAIVSTLNPAAFALPEEARLVKHCFEVRAVPDETPFAFTICECPRVGAPHYDTLEDARDFLQEHGITDPQIGFNPTG
jgi:hypothetical protein